MSLSPFQTGTCHICCQSVAIFLWDHGIMICLCMKNYNFFSSCALLPSLVDADDQPLWFCLAECFSRLRMIRFHSCWSSWTEMMWEFDTNSWLWLFSEARPCLEQKISTYLAVCKPYIMFFSYLDAESSSSATQNIYPSYDQFLLWKLPVYAGSYFWNGVISDLTVSRRTAHFAKYKRNSLMLHLQTSIQA